MRPDVTAFFDEPTNTVSYVVKDPTSNACAIVDSVLDFDNAAGRVEPPGWGVVRGVGSKRRLVACFWPGGASPSSSP